MRSAISILAALTAAACPAQTIQSVLNAASYGTAVAPYTWVAIFGTQLAPSAQAATSVPFPISLNGVSVTFNGAAAPLSYVSSGQINALVPVEAATLTGSQTATIPVIVKTSAGTSSAFSLNLQSAAPAIYTKDQSGSGAALAFDAAFNPVTTVTTAPLVLYGTGLGQTNPPAGTLSLGASAEPLNRTVILPQVNIGDNPATVSYSGLAPGLHGIYQLNVLPNPKLGNQLQVSSGLFNAPTLTLPLPAGTNVANVMGTIDALYPLTTTTLGFSALAAIGTFTASFDILPNAAPFEVEATGPGSTAIITINPSQGTWQATYTVPSTLSRNWNFSSAGFTVTDFVSGTPFPGNVIPLSRVDPAAAAALSTLPLSNNGAISGANGAWSTSGTIPPNGHFTVTIAADPGTTVGNFGGFVNVTRGPQVATFELYIDNLTVATKQISFTTD
jgi:uncharacterized protein (TIGR03437 family)